MIVQKSVLFLPEPNVVAQELADMLLDQARTLGTVDIPKVQQFILDRSKMVHSRRVLSGLALESAYDAKEFVASEERVMEREMALAVMKELNVVTRSYEDHSIVGHDK